MLAHVPGPAAADSACCTQGGDEYPVLDEVLQQLAVICSFDSFQPADADKLPGHLSTIWDTLSLLPAKHRLGVRDIAHVIDGHLASSGTSAASTAEKKPSLLQDAPAGPDSSSESDEEVAVRRALHTGPQPVKAHDKAAAAAGKSQTAAATSSWANNLADAMRPAPAPVNDGDQRAANKRLQLRNKLKRTHEAAGNQGASQKAEPAVPTLAEVEPITEDLSLPQDDELLSMLAPAIAKKQSRKMLKRARRRAAAAAAAAAAAETAAGPADLQLDIPSDGLSTAEGTSSSSAASLVGSEAGTPPARGQPDVAQQSTAAADDPASSSKQGEEAAQSNAASTSHLPAADSSAPAAIAPSSGTAETDSTLARPHAAPESAQSDIKQPVVNGADSGSAQMGTMPDTSKQTPDDTTASPAAAPAPQADATQALHKPLVSAEHISGSSLPTRSLAPPSPTPPQASSVADTSKIPISSADTAPGGATVKDAGVQPPKPDSLAQQKLERRPSAGVAAAAPPPPPPAAIAAHRPAPKAVLRASAAPYTPLSSKAVLADSNKAPAVGVRPGPAANSGTQDKGKRKVPAGTCLSSATHRSECLSVRLMLHYIGGC